MQRKLRKLQYFARCDENNENYENCEIFPKKEESLTRIAEGPDENCEFYENYENCDILRRCDENYENFKYERASSKRTQPFCSNQRFNHLR